MRARALVAAAAAAGIAASAASAHGPEGGGTGYISTFAALDPPVAGVFVTVLGGTHELQVANYTGKRIEVYADEVFEKPRWVAIANGSSFTWHERRIRWTARKPPKAVAEEPDVDHRIFEWTIPGRVAGERFRILGFLGYRPAPHSSDDRGLAAWAVGLVAAAGAAALLGAVLRARRLSRRRAP